MKRLTTDIQKLHQLDQDYQKAIQAFQDQKKRLLARIGPSLKAHRMEGRIKQLTLAKQIGIESSALSVIESGSYEHVGSATIEKMVKWTSQGITAPEPAWQTSDS